MTKSFLTYALVAATVFSSPMASIAQANSQPMPAAELDAALNASISEADIQATKLLLGTAVVTSQIGNVVEVSPEIRAKYESAAMAVGYSVPVLAVGGAFSATTTAFFAKVKFIFKPLTWLFREVLYPSSVKPTLEAAEWISTKLKLDKAIEFSSEKLSGLWDVVVKVVGSSITKGTVYAVGSGSTGSILYVSYNLLFKDVEEVLSYDMVRARLGQDAVMAQRLEATLTQADKIFSLGADKKAKLKDALISKITEQAVNSKFDRNANYSVDVGQVVIENGWVSAETATAYANIKEVFSNVTLQNVEPSKVEQLANSVSLIAGLAAVLESQSAAGLLDEASQKEVDYLLANANRTLSRIKANLAQ